MSTRDGRGDQAVQPLGLVGQFGVRALDLGEVAQEAGEDGSAADGDLHRGQLGDPLGAVRVPRRHPELAGELLRAAGGQVGADVLEDPGPVRLRDEDLGQRPAEHVVAPVAGQLLRRGVELDQPAVGVHGQHRDRRPRDQRPGQHLPLGQRGHVVGVPNLRGHNGGHRVRGRPDLGVPGSLVDGRGRGIPDQGQRAQAPAVDRHRTGQQHAAQLLVQRHHQRALRALTPCPGARCNVALRHVARGHVALRRGDHADPGQQRMIHRSRRVRREHGGLLRGRTRACRRLAPGWLKGQRRPQAERLHHPGQHGRQRAERRVVPQDLRDGEIEHRGRGPAPPLTGRRPHEGHPKSRRATIT
jgi:hypothetical protein